MFQIFLNLLNTAMLLTIQTATIKYQLIQLDKVVLYIRIHVHLLIIRRIK